MPRLHVRGFTTEAARHASRGNPRATHIVDGRPGLGASGRIGYGGGKVQGGTIFTVIAEIARNVAGDAAIIESITRPGAEIHDYQPTPGDIRREQEPG